ncbi:triosephosphate isomerase [Candidatus Falkowbacteria bacterium]|nr:triosephosphate isomerase [Candidatus Falkowbacteria bacterium]
MSKSLTIIANWKMRLDIHESVFLVKQYKKLKLPKSLKLVVAPTTGALPAVAQLLRFTKIHLAGQDAAWEESAALTGETSPLLLRQLGCSHVILGHSERKMYFHEDLSMTARRVGAAVHQNLIPIICVGESEEEHRRGLTHTVLERQVKQVLAGVARLEHQPIILSYEPFWTISTSHGRIATSREVDQACRVIHQAAVDLFSAAAVARQCTIVYGGTVNVKTIGQFAALSSLGGFLVGAAAVDIAAFRQLISQI